MLKILRAIVGHPQLQPVGVLPNRFRSPVLPVAGGIPALEPVHADIDIVAPVGNDNDDDNHDNDDVNSPVSPVLSVREPDAVQQLVCGSQPVVGGAAPDIGWCQDESVGPVVRASVAGLHHATAAAKLALRGGVVQ